MRPHYQQPCNKRYFHTKLKMDKRDMATLKKKIQLIQRKKTIRKNEGRFIRG